MPFRRRAVLGPALAAALAVSGLATLAPPATALVPDGGLRVLVTGDGHRKAEQVVRFHTW